MASNLAEGFYQATFTQQQPGNAEAGIQAIGRVTFKNLPASIADGGPPRDGYPAFILEPKKLGALIRASRHPDPKLPPRLSQSKLAGDCGLGQSTVADIENGDNQPTIPRAAALLRRLGVGVLFFSLGNLPEGDTESRSSHHLLLLAPEDGYSARLGRYLAQQINSQQEFADSLGVTQPTISDFVTGDSKNPRMERIERLFAGANMKAGLMLISVLPE